MAILRLVNDLNEMMIPEEVMLDMDLAKLYEVETRILNQAVKINEKLCTFNTKDKNHTFKGFVLKHDLP